VTSSPPSTFYEVMKCRERVCSRVPDLWTVSFLLLIFVLHPVLITWHDVTLGVGGFGTFIDEKCDGTESANHVIYVEFLA
jgi:nitrate reductase NapE component